MRVKVWGARGSVPSPGPETSRYGGNTSCVQVTLADGSMLVLDAGTGIRNLGRGRGRERRRLNVLLTHLHMDHIQGLMFFAPLFRQTAEIAIWGPAAPGEPLLDRIARYISAPLSPLEVGELLPASSGRDAPLLRMADRPGVHQGGPGPAPRPHARLSDHRGRHLALLPTRPRAERRRGLGRPHSARGATLLVHDCQYTDDEYPAHAGWGHSSLSDALAFAQRAEAERLLLFHHDPLHTDDFLDRLHGSATARWAELGGHPGAVELAAEHVELDL